jgi:aspartyl/asparaginyl-tRNA synthetase
MISSNPVFSTNPNAGASAGFDPTGLIAMGFSTISSLVMANKEKSEQKKLQEKINKLSIAQRLELEKKLNQSKSQNEQMEILYKTLNVVKHNAVLSSLNKEKTTGIIILGIGFIILTTFIVIKKSKK